MPWPRSTGTESPGLCPVHAERLVHKLDTFTDQHRGAQTQVRSKIWDFYADLKAYRLKPGKRRAATLRARFDRIFLRPTGLATLYRMLARLHANNAEWLMVLARLEVPLHTNGSEDDIRQPSPRNPMTAIKIARSMPGMALRTATPTKPAIESQHSHGWIRWNCRGFASSITPTAEAMTTAASAEVGRFPNK